MRKFEDHISVVTERLAQLSGSDMDERIERAVRMIVSSLTAKRPLMVCGNGGSASDALHISGELVGRFLRERRALNVICLSANVAVMTAWANDYVYDQIFARQVEAHGSSGGVLLGLSTSGNSQNVVSAFQVAKTMGVQTIAITGEGGGRLAPYSDVLLSVPSTSTPRIQEMHVVLYHYLCERIESEVALTSVAYLDV